MAKSTKLSKMTINRLTKTQFKNGSFPPDSVNLVDPEFVGARVLVTDSGGDVVESATGSGLLDNLNGVTGPIQDQIDSLKAGAAKAEYISKDGYELHPDRSWSRTYDVEHQGKATVNYDDGNTVVLDESGPYAYENENFALSWYTSGDSGQWGFYDKAKKSLDYIYDYAKTDTSLRYDEKSADITIEPAHSTKETETGVVALVSDIADAVKVDASLDESSENPVQNKAVFAELKTKATVEALSAKRDKTDLEYAFPAPLGIEKWTGTFGSMSVTLTWNADESKWSDDGGQVVIRQVSGDTFRFSSMSGDFTFTGTSADYTYSDEFGYRVVLSAVVTTDTIALKSDIVAPDAVLNQESTNPVQNKAVAVGIQNAESLIAAHTGDLENPHVVTAEQAGALPVSGGELTGNLTVGKGAGERVLTVIGANGVAGVTLNGGMSDQDMYGGRVYVDGHPYGGGGRVIVQNGAYGGGEFLALGGNTTGGTITLKGRTGTDGVEAVLGGGNNNDGAPFLLLRDNTNATPSVKAEVTIGGLKVRETIEKISGTVESVKATTVNGKPLSGGAVTLAASDVGAVPVDTDGFRIEVASDAEATPLSLSPALAAEAGASLQYLAIGPTDNASKIRPDGTDVLTRGVADGIYALKSEIPKGSIVDSQFSATSKNPLQNSVVTKKFASVESDIETKVASRFPSSGGRIATNDIGFISVVPYSAETSVGGVIAISGDPNYVQKGGEIHVGGGVHTGGSIRVYASTVSGFNDHPKYYPGSVYIQKDDGTWMDLAGEIAKNRNDIQYTWSVSANLVTKNQKINNKALTSDITLVAADVGAVAVETDPVFTAWKNGATIVLGHAANSASDETSGVAIGYQAVLNAGANYGIAIGFDATASERNSVSIGHDTTSHGEDTFNINAKSLDKVFLGAKSLDSLINTKVSEGTVADTELSETSTNAVQNKVIKAAVDLKADKDALKTGTFDFATMKGVYEALKSVIETFGGTVTNYPTMTE